LLWLFYDYDDYFAGKAQAPDPLEKLEDKAKEYFAKKSNPKKGTDPKKGPASKKVTAARKGSAPKEVAEPSAGPKKRKRIINEGELLRVSSQDVVDVL